MKKIFVKFHTIIVRIIVILNKNKNHEKSAKTAKQVFKIFAGVFPDLDISNVQNQEKAK